jgi:hypothetical protein
MAAIGFVQETAPMQEEAIKRPLAAWQDFAINFPPLNEICLL